MSRKNDLKIMIRVDPELNDLIDEYVKAVDMPFYSKSKLIKDAIYSHLGETDESSNKNQFVYYVLEYAYANGLVSKEEYKAKQGFDPTDYAEQMRQEREAALNKVKNLTLKRRSDKK